MQPMVGPAISCCRVACKHRSIAVSHHQFLILQVQQQQHRQIVEGCAGTVSTMSMFWF